MIGPKPMSSDRQHCIYRHPAAPWAELRVSVNTRDCYRPHAHDEYSIGIVDQGNAIFHHASGPHQVRAGSVVLIEPQVVHSCNPMSGQAWSYRMLFINAAWLQAALAKVWGLAVPPNGLEFMSRTIEDLFIGQSVNQLCLSAELPTLLAGLTRPGKPVDEVQVPAELTPALALIQMEGERRVTVADLSKACKMSSSQFIRRFQTVLGMTPGSYMQNLRINGARRLMSQGVALSDAAHTMGFADQAHMQRAFKAHHAMTPGNYRSEH
jgi:AraC-like DNA-binding protein